MLNVFSVAAEFISKQKKTERNSKILLKTTKKRTLNINIYCFWLKWIIFETFIPDSHIVSMSYVCWHRQLILLLLFGFVLIYFRWNFMWNIQIMVESLHKTVKREIVFVFGGKEFWKFYAIYIDQAHLPYSISTQQIFTEICYSNPWNIYWQKVYRKLLLPKTLFYDLNFDEFMSFNIFEMLTTVRSEPTMCIFQKYAMVNKKTS